MPILRRIDGLSFGERAEYREGLRNLQADGLELYDVAVMAICPFLSTFNKESLEGIYAWVSVWKSQGLVQDEVYEHFCEEMSRFLGGT